MAILINVFVESYFSKICDTLFNHILGVYRFIRSKNLTIGVMSILEFLLKIQMLVYIPNCGFKIYYISVR